tara:strand:- start:50 stop:454 length:405 start_codon:yes stop_codon:yes gene_type:complete
MEDRNSYKGLEDNIKACDEKLSRRFIALDPNGYFLIKIDPKKKELIVEHYSNSIDKQGIAVDPATGKPIQCKDTSYSRDPIKRYKAKTAKDLGIKLSEGEGVLPISRIDHAMYLGRELQKAEYCLIKGINYIQD